MNVLKLVPAIALIMGLTSVSFAGTPKGETKDTKAEAATTQTNEECYLNSSGQFRVKANGTCLFESSSYCTYIYIGEGTAGEDQDETHYQPVENSLNEKWVPAP